MWSPSPATVLLGDVPLAAGTDADVGRAFDEVLGHRAAMPAARARARAWELHTLSTRPTTFRRILRLALGIAEPA